ncbi:MAG: AMP-binding protein, partial [Akkermansiaceae bacterium]|nr:AMP-binding protein [Verrucomicrobiales bacterium]
MNLEAIATTPRYAGPVSKMAIAEGAPLSINSGAPTTLTEALRRSAREHPSQGILLPQNQGSPQLLTYPELLDRASRAAAGLRRQGLKPGDKAILQLDSLADHFTVFWGCQLVGIVPVTVAIAPTYAERNGIVDKLHNTWKLLGEPVILTTERLEPALKSLAAVLSSSPLKTLCVEELRRTEPDANSHTVHPEDIAFIQLSSGSTGVPKCIQETHRAIIAHVHSGT